MTPRRPTDNEPPDGLSYEDFDDAPSWESSADLPPLDLDALDDEIDEPAPEQAAPSALPAAPPEEPGVEPVVLDLDALGDAIEEPAAAAALPADLPGTPQPPPTEEDTLHLAAPAVESPPPAEPEPEPTPKPARSKRRSLKTRTAAPDETPASLPAPPVSVAEERAAPPDTIYRVLLLLPPALSAQAARLRETGQIVGEPPPGIELIGGFRAADPPAVEAALAAWAKNHLPMQLEITGVLAQVNGAQDYVAAWTLQPEKELCEAQAALRRVLEPLIVPLPDAPTAFFARITLGARVPPQPYPRLIGQMQRSFEPEVWQAEQVSLVQTQPETAPGAWEVVGAFR